MAIPAAFGQVVFDFNQALQIPAAKFANWPKAATSSAPNQWC